MLQNVKVLQNDGSVTLTLGSKFTAGNGPYKYTVTAPKLPDSNWDGTLPSDTVWETRTPAPKGGIPFRLCKELGLIKMTPYARSKVVQTCPQAVIQVCNHSNPHVQDVVSSYPSYKKADAQWAPLVFNPKVSYVLSYHPLDFIVQNAVAFNKAGIWFGNGRVQHSFDADIGSVIETVKTSTVAAHNTNYDILTEYAERIETFKTILTLLQAIVKPTEALKKVLQEIKDETLVQARQRARRNGEYVGGSIAVDFSDVLAKKSANAWLQYRYAVMPIYYSIKDILELMEEKNAVFQTTREGEAVTRRITEVVDCGAAQALVTFEGKYRINGVGKSSYDNTQARLASLISVNPFVTAWELTRLSFVIDWAINIGDFINAQTSSLLSLATQTVYTISVKETETLTVSIVPNSIKTNWSAGEYPSPPHNWINWGWYKAGDFRKAGVLVLPRVDDYFMETIIFKETAESYDRKLFSPTTDTHLSINLNMNVKRWMDSVSLLYKPLSKSLRSLK